jgi:hypothetical protein
MSIWLPTTNIIRIGKYTFTKDKIFAIEPVATSEDYEPEKQTYSNKLYIQSGYQIDPSSALSSLISDNIIVKKGAANLGTSKSPKMYDTYEFYKLLKDDRPYINGEPDYDDDSAVNENDCLKFAECLTITSQTHDKNLLEELLKGNKNPPLLQTSVTGKIFSETENDKDNIRKLGEIGLSKKNNYAIPKSGESYAIVRKKINENAAYHASFVLYSHDGVNITLEAEADAGATYQPKFCFYDTNPHGNTFHKRWSAELYKKSTDPEDQARYNALYNNGETIVLKSRNINDMMQEIDAEKRKLTTEVSAIEQPTKRRRTVGGKKVKTRKQQNKKNQKKSKKQKTRKSKKTKISKK